jgi:diphthine-ammonia ligase
MHNAAMLWTGGKDSSLALYEAAQSGYDVRCLVTFAPAQPDFLAHPLRFIQMQAQAMALPHYILPVSAPFDESYEAGLRKLRDDMAIQCVVTGDIAEVDGHPNWIRERSRPASVNVHTPLWGRDRNTLLRQLLDNGFKVRISCVNTRWLDASWVGREINDAAIAELRSIREQNGLDLCGEEGEYHTLVVDGPPFTRRLDIRAFSTRTADALAYMQIHEVGLIDRGTDSTC